MKSPLNQSKTSEQFHSHPIIYIYIYISLSLTIPYYSPMKKTPKSQGSPWPPVASAMSLSAVFRAVTSSARRATTRPVSKGLSQTTWGCTEMGKAFWCFLIFFLKMGKYHGNSDVFWIKHHAFFHWTFWSSGNIGLWLFFLTIGRPFGRDLTPCFTFPFLRDLNNTKIQGGLQQLMVDHGDVFGISGDQPFYGHVNQAPPSNRGPPILQVLQKPKYLTALKIVPIQLFFWCVGYSELQGDASQALEAQGLHPPKESNRSNLNKERLGFSPGANWSKSMWTPNKP